jgi:metallo-beta-lactamase class B
MPAGGGMKTLTAGGLALLAAAGLSLSAAGQGTPDIDAHVAAARAAAGAEFRGVFNRICDEAVPSLNLRTASQRERAPRTPGPPARETWYAEPAKVFDNLYFLGQTEYSAWAVVTSQGIIVIDTIYDYSVEEEVVGGLRKLGLDPAQIKYAIVSHGHGDHSGGAKYLQDHFGTKILLSEADWDLLERSSGTKPRRDMVATDGQRLTLGDTTVTMHLTPGHTLGTLSTLVPVRDNGRAHVAANWGGTAFNWMRGGPEYITPQRPQAFWFQTYSDSAKRFKEIAARAGADVIIANHTMFDGTTTKIPALKTRQPNQPHPYVIGKEGVQRYMTTVQECALAGLARAKG